MPLEGGIGERARGPQNNIHSWANDASMLVADLAKTKTNSLREAPVSLRGRGPGSPPVVTLSVPPWRSSACISPPQRPPLPSPCLSPHRGEGQGGGRGGLYKRGTLKFAKADVAPFNFLPAQVGVVWCFEGRKFRTRPPFYNTQHPILGYR